MSTVTYSEPDLSSPLDGRAVANLVKPDNGSALRGVEVERWPTGRRASIDSRWVDRIGVLAAALCTVHCAILVALPVVTALVGATPWFDPRFRWLAVCVSALLVVASLARGRKLGAPAARSETLLVGGLFLLVGGRLLETLWATSEVLPVAGGLLMVAGHWRRASMETREIAASTPTQGASSSRGARRRIADALLVVACLTLVFYFVAGPRTLPSSAMAVAMASDESNDGGAPKIGWDLLAQLNVATGETSPELGKMVDQRVRIPGYVVPLDEEGMEFLLAPWLGACFHEPTPPPNQMVHVRLKKGAEPIDPWGWDPLWVTGKLSVSVTESPYGAVGYELDGESAEIYRW